jgi:hypothetical protein
MQPVKIIDYDCLKESEIEVLHKITSDLSLTEQLWFIALLADSKVKICIYLDYETILFVPFRSKFGVSYAYMPTFLQKLNFIGSNSGINAIMDALFKTLRFGEISLSENLAVGIGESCIKERKNYKLELGSTYEDIRKKYAKNHIRNFKKASTIEVLNGADFSGLISIFESEKKSVFHKKQMQEFIYNLKKMEKCERIKKHTLIYNAFIGKRLVASIFIIKFNGVLYYILGSSIKSDCKVSSLGLYRLFDYLIELHSNQGLILDFEGSDHPGIARFFKGFGSVDTSFYFMRWNHLPFPFKLIKN